MEEKSPTKQAELGQKALTNRGARQSERATRVVAAQSISQKKSSQVVPVRRLRRIRAVVI
jgi:hypothetical protein